MSENTKQQEMSRLPVRIRVLSHVQKTVQRVMPEHTEILVKKGDEVYPEKVIGLAKTAAGFRSFRLADLLDVKHPKDVRQYLVCKEGDKVYKGQQIAEKKGFLGIGTKVVTSPIDGVVQSFHEDTGRLTMGFLPSVVRIAAGMPGIVDTSETDRSVSIHSTVTQVFGVLGAGRERAGFIKVTVKPDDFLLPANIEAVHAGSILVGGALITRDTLEKALAIGVAGIITGGIHLKDFESIGGEKVVQIGSVGTDVGLTILVTEGFGRIPMGEDIWGTLFRLNDRYALIDGETRSVVVPEEGEGEKLPESVSLQEKEVAVGDSARIIAEPEIGTIGKVVSIGKEKELLDSGLSAYMVELQIGKEKKRVPAQNLEIILSQTYK